MKFDQNNPKAGAEQLLFWAWDVLNLRENGVQIPEEWTQKSIAEFFTHIDFAGERFVFAAHFSVAALAKHELSAEDYESIFEFLADSVKGYKSKFNDEDHHFDAAIQIGIVADARTLSWAMQSGLGEKFLQYLAGEIVGAGADHADEALVDFAIETKKTDVLKRVAYRLKWSESYSLLQRCIDAIPEILQDSNFRNFMSERTRSGSIFDDPVDSFVNEDFLKTLTPAFKTEDIDSLTSEIQHLKDAYDRCEILIALSATAIRENRFAEAVPAWLNEAKGLLNKARKEDDIYFDLIQGREFLEKQYWIQMTRLGKTDGREAWEARLLDLAETVESEDRGGVITALCEVWVAEYDFDKILTHFNYLDFDYGNSAVVSRFSEMWKAPEHLDEILEKFTDGDDYDHERFLISVANILGIRSLFSEGEKVAEHLREYFETDDGFEALATIHLAKENYEEAQRLGGGNFQSHGIFREKFPIDSGNSALARDYIHAVRGAERSPNWMKRLAWSGHPREAIGNLYYSQLQEHVSNWVFGDFYDDREDYPRDYGKLAQYAMSIARDEQKNENQGEPRASVVTRLLHHTASVFHTGNPPESSEEKRRKKQTEIAEGLSDALVLEEREPRLEALKKVAQNCFFRDSCWVGQKVHAPKLIAALWRELELLLKEEKQMAKHERAGCWESIALALGEAHAWNESAIAWTHHECHQPVPDGFIEYVVRHIDKEHWHVLAPLCRRDPKNAITLAARLKLWFPKARIEFPLRHLP